MFRSISGLMLLFSLQAIAHSQSANCFILSNLVSDGSVPARTIDKQLIDPWGIASGLRTPFWFNTADSGRSEVYNGGGNRQFVLQIPAAGGQSKMGLTAGIAFRPSATEFIIPHSSTALFLRDMTMASVSFGAFRPFGADLLIGNFNDGKTNAFGPNTFAFKSQLQDGSGKSL